MKYYICSYSDNSTPAGESEVFLCQADNEEHAREQCENAYPSAFIAEVYEDENFSTENYAEIIAESITNGQRSQAVRQFKDAMAQHCSALSLAEDIAGQGIDASKVFTLLCRIIEGSK